MCVHCSFSPQRELIDFAKAGGEPGVRLDITLMRDDDQHWSSANDYRIIENVVRTRYHSDEEIRELLAEFELHSVTKTGQIASFGYADNEFDLYFHSLKLTEDVS